MIQTYTNGAKFASNGKRGRQGEERQKGINIPPAPLPVPAPIEAAAKAKIISAALIFTIHPGEVSEKR